MGSIYMKSYVTTCASGASGVHEGFVEPRRQNEVFYGRVQHKGYSKALYLTCSPGDRTLDGFLQREPLNTRGWALQERMLSTRKILFGPSQMFRQCQVSTLTESGGIIYHETMDPATPGAGWTAVGLWLQTVSRYSECSVTKTSDHLPALSGTAKKFSRVESCGDYVETGGITLWCLFFGQ
ncbi:hypothetical protein JX266_002027 [Neoarthrinium moseri]|nr:hypothetical protein JX266_002027 [Neoarthrinium moseri]